MVLTLLRTMLSSTATAATASAATATATVTATATATTAGWKWEVNHDGAVLAYQGSPSRSSSAPSAPEAPSGRKEHVPRTRTSLVDYWYLVHDGVVIPTVNDH